MSYVEKLTSKKTEMIREDKKTYSTSPPQAFTYFLNALDSGSGPAAGPPTWPHVAHLHAFVWHLSGTSETCPVVSKMVAIHHVSLFTLNFILIKIKHKNSFLQSHWPHFKCLIASYMWLMTTRVGSANKDHFQQWKKFQWTVLVYSFSFQPKLAFSVIT